MLERLYIGPAGWSYPDWNGAVYPSKKPQGFDPLSYLSSYFNLIEINSTFYHPPTPESCRRWVERVGSNAEFKFSLKAFRRFTHTPEPVGPVEIEAFKRTIRPLFEGGKLLAVLLQFPWSFKDSARNREHLSRLIDGFTPLPLCVEVRHGSWAREPAFAFLKESGVSVCGVDQPAIGDSISARTRIYGEAGAYFRFHGRNHREWFRAGTNRDLRYNYLYSRNELSPFLDPIRRAAEKTRQVAVVLNNHFRGQAVANALELKSMLLGRKIPVPRTLLRVYPRIEAIAEEDKNASGNEGWLFDSTTNGQK